MSLETIVQALGGLALFLFAMQRMTEGLTVFAGSGLKRLLGRWTSTPLRGVFAGILVTGLVQSSSAVTVATIGFVNAGLLTLRQALGVIFGTNVGTTMTGWLVSLVGFGFKIEAFALPILTVGVVLRLVASGRRYQGLGEALAGFGLFFLGLALLKDAFGGMADVYGASVASGGGGVSWLAFVLVGFVATVLTQSSSAAIAIILTAAAGGVIGLEAAAAAVIGANLGTTSTAAIAVLKATPAAKRLAIGHIAFNLVTGLVALALLPLMLAVVARLADWLDVEGSPAAILALFHTVFNVLGVLLMLPLADRLATLLERLFRSEADELARPQHLDATLAATPALAAAALHEELGRLRGIVSNVAQAALTGPAPVLQRQSDAVRRLVEAIQGFVSSVRAEATAEDVGAELAGALAAARYLQEAAALAPSGAALRSRAASLEDVAIRAAFEQFIVEAAQVASLAEANMVEPGDDGLRSAALERLQRRYRETKEALLVAAVARRLSVEDTDALLDDLRATRRLVDQLLKGDRLLHGPTRAAEIEAEARAT
jgi:phosphate:Na+ symporter